MRLEISRCLGGSADNFHGDSDVAARSIRELVSLADSIPIVCTSGSLLQPLAYTYPGSSLKCNNFTESSITYSSVFSSLKGSRDRLKLCLEDISQEFRVIALVTLHLQSHSSVTANPCFSITDSSERPECAVTFYHSPLFFSRGCVCGSVDLIGEKIFLT